MAPQEDPKKVEERDARAVTRSLAKEAPAAMEPLPKKARVDASSSDLISLLTTSTSVLDIFAASGSRPNEVKNLENLILIVMLLFIGPRSPGPIYVSGCL